MHKFIAFANNNNNEKKKTQTKKRSEQTVRTRVWVCKCIAHATFMCAIDPKCIPLLQNSWNYKIRWQISGNSHKMNLIVHSSFISVCAYVTFHIRSFSMAAILFSRLRAQYRPCQTGSTRNFAIFRLHMFFDLLHYQHEFFSTNTQCNQMLLCTHRLWKKMCISSWNATPELYIL